MSSPVINSALSAVDSGELRARLESDLRFEQQRVLNLDSDGSGENDAIASAQVDVRTQTAAVSRKRIGELVAALERLDGGHYGLCERCSNPIAPERLELLPHARYCIGCQSAIDRSM